MSGDGSQGTGRRWMLAAVAVLLAVGGWGLWQLRTDRPPTTEEPQAEATESPEAPVAPWERLTSGNLFDRPAIAVLPLKGGDASNAEPFTHGVSGELIRALASRRAFPVIARASSLLQPVVAEDLAGAGRELGARFVVSGEIRATDSHVQLRARVVDVESGGEVGEQTVEGERAALLRLLDELAAGLAASAYPDVPEASVSTAVPPAGDLAAVEHVWRGWWHFYQNTAASNAEARSAFMEATRVEPRFAEAWYGLASTYHRDLLYGWTRSLPESAMALGRVAQKTAKLRADAAERHLVLGMVAGAGGQAEQMALAFERAIMFDPSCAMAHFFYGSALSEAGRSNEALQPLRHALRLSPRDPMRWAFRYWLAQANFSTGRDAEAAEQARASLEERPDFLVAHLVLAASQVNLERLEEARTAWAAAAKLAPGLSLATLTQRLRTSDPAFVDRLSQALQQLGEPDETAAAPAATGRRS